MEKWSLNNLEIGAIKSDIDENILISLKTPILNREGFKYNAHVVTIPIYFYRFIGVKTDENEYFENICKIDKELSRYDTLYKRFVNGLDKDISIQLQNKINTIWSKVYSNGIVDSSYLIELLSSSNLFVNLNNDVLERQIKNNFKGLLDYYVKSIPNINFEKVRLIINYIIHWNHLYLKDMFKNFDYTNINPKILYYGEITPEEIFYLIFLSTLGCDIIYFNPNNAEEFNDVDKFNVFSKEILYSTRCEIKDFPQSFSDRVKTTAYNAKEELDKTLYTDETGFYRPWQFENHLVKATTLKTTYEEIYIWIKENASIRDGFKIYKDEIYIPNIFAKISGTHEELNNYWRDIDNIVTQEKVHFYKKLPIMSPCHLEYSKFSYVYPSTHFAQFDVDALINAPWWKYKGLRYGLQRNIGEKIKELCLNPVIMNNENLQLRDFQVDIFSILINLDMELMNILQAYDFSQEIPKMVIYNNEKNGNLSYEDCVMLTFMNSMGIDIVIFNPSGYNDIENYIYSDLYDVHRLSEVSFKLGFQKYEEKKGFFKSFFKF